MKCSTCHHSWCVMCELPSDSWFHYIQVGGLNCQILNILRYEIKTFFIMKMALFLFLITVAPLLLYFVFITFGISIMIKHLEYNCYCMLCSENLIRTKVLEVHTILTFFLYLLVSIISFVITNLIFPLSFILLEISLILTFFRMVQLEIR